MLWKWSVDAGGLLMPGLLFVAFVYGYGWCSWRIGCFLCVCIAGLLLMALSPFCCLDICIWSIALHFDRWSILIHD